MVRLQSSSDLGASRDLFLDAVRAIAVVRVVTWHTYGWAPITWVISAVPAMFFVSGHLLARSFARRRPRAVVLDRLRRLLLPFWAFGLVAWLIMAIARQLEGTPETRLSGRSVVWWVLPFNDPHGSVWEAGWLSQPLWYLRCLFCLLLVSPSLFRLMRRWPKALVGSLIAVTLGLELAFRHVAWRNEALPNALWRAGDLTLYATFLVLGFWHSWRPPIAPRVAALAATFAVPLSVVVAVVANPQDDVVNNSHMLHLVVGGGWLAVALALRSSIGAFANRPIPRWVIGGIGRRSLTIYLWHSAAVITTWQVLVRLAPLPRGVHSALWGLGTLVGTAALVRATGWIEDRAARRPVAARPAPAPQRHGQRPAFARAWFVAPLSGLALFGVAGSMVLPDTAEPQRPTLSAAQDPGTLEAKEVGAARPPASPRVPSRAPRVQLSPTTLPPADHTTEPTAEEPSGGGGPVGEPTDVQGVLDRWQYAHASSGLLVGYARGNAEPWVGGPFGVSGEGSFDIESVTKSITAAAVWILAGEGVVSVDAPIVAIGALPELADRGLTLRQLLEHRSGIPDYHDLETPEDVGEDPAVTVVRHALAAGERFAPGAGQDYSSTNYLIIGLVIEASTGRSLDDVLWSKVLDPAGVGAHFSRAGASTYLPGGGAGGLRTDLRGMLAWGRALLRNHQPVGEAVWARMTNFSAATGMGAGLMGVCPCTGSFVWVGHTGGTTALFYSGSDDLLVAVRIANGIWGPFEDPFAELMAGVRAMALAQ